MVAKPKVKQHNRTKVTFRPTLFKSSNFCYKITEHLLKKKGNLKNSSILNEQMAFPEVSMKSSFDTRFSLQWGDPSSIPGWGRFPGGGGGGHGNPLQYSCLENPHRQRSLAGYSPWSCKESDTTEQLSTHICTGRSTEGTMLLLKPG